MSTVVDKSWLIDTISGDKDGDRSLSARFVAWGNSPNSAIFWVVLGCVCSFFLPVFLYLDEGKGVGDVCPVRLIVMLVSCVVAAGVYRVAFKIRHHRLMREKPPLRICCFICIALSVIFVDEGTWPTVVGLELLAVAVFVLLEMGRPALDFFMLRFFTCLPIIAGGRRHGWDVVLLGWPMLIVAAILLLWREFFVEHRRPQF